MLISENLTLAANKLKQKGVDSARIDALLLLCHCLSKSREQIIFNQNLQLTLKEQEHFDDLVQRRENREPISHIIGKREFFGNDFVVSSNVLDPRPDSESLIELALEIFPDKNQPLNVLELGLGSGCLLATILKYFPNAYGIGIDISHKALEIAKQNINLLKLAARSRLIQSSWFENLDHAQKFDLIISNPPYIKTSDILFLQEEVKNFEPHLALDGGISGLDCYIQIAKNVKDFLKDRGVLIVEIGQNQHQDVIKIFTQTKLKFIQEKQDLSGIIRCLLFQRIDENI